MIGAEYAARPQRGGFPQDDRTRSDPPVSHEGAPDLSEFALPPGPGQVSAIYVARFQMSGLT